MTDNMCAPGPSAAVAGPGTQPAFYRRGGTVGLGTRTAHSKGLVVPRLTRSPRLPRKADATHSSRGTAAARARDSDMDSPTFFTDLAGASAVLRSPLVARCSLPPLTPIPNRVTLREWRAPRSQGCRGCGSGGGRWGSAGRAAGAVDSIAACARSCGGAGHGCRRRPARLVGGAGADEWGDSGDRLAEIQKAARHG